MTSLPRGRPSSFLWALACAHLLLAGLPRVVEAQVPTPRTVGDVTRDGRIRASDALAILLHLVGKPLPAEFSVDPDGDAACLTGVEAAVGQSQATDMLVRAASGAISAADALVVLRHVVGLQTDHTCVGFQPDTTWTLSWWDGQTDSLGVVGLSGFVRPQLLTSSGGFPAEWNGKFAADSVKSQALLRVSVDDPALVNVDTLYFFSLSPLVRAYGKAPGDARITARWFDQEADLSFPVIPWVPTSMSMTVNQVQRPGGIYVSDLTVGDTTRAFAAASDSLGHTMKLTASAVLWTSANPAVATVSAEGVITAKAPGSVMISAAWSTLSVSTPLTVVSNAGAIDQDVARLLKTWVDGVYSYFGPGLFLSNAAFQHSAPWANAGMEQYGRIPRIAVINDPSNQYFGNFSRPWDFSYRVILSASNALNHLDDADVVAALGPTNVSRDKAFARFALALGHATVAVLYDRGFVIDETTDLGQVLDRPYAEVMDSALAYFGDAIALSEGGAFTVPFEWMGASVTASQLAEVAHSLKARYRVAVARTPAERQSVNWNAVISDVDAGVNASFLTDMDPNAGWDVGVVEYGTTPGWSESPYWLYGMADQAGNYQRWLALSMADKHPAPSDGPVLIVTPDTRFPQGATLADQQANAGSYVRSPTDISGVWARPDRGTWRWSYYHLYRFRSYYEGTDFTYPEINIREMQLLKAEGLYLKGDRAGAAAIVNESRVVSGLNATDAAGTNTDCVPKLPNGACGDLFEMLKWEKRMEGTFQGLFGAPWYFDSRGWGDLWKNTPLQFPVPCKQYPNLPLPTLPCTTYGGGGEMSASASSYAFPWEG